MTVGGDGGVGVKWDAGCAKRAASVVLGWESF
jgi:hypothetical protein